MTSMPPPPGAPYDPRLKAAAKEINAVIKKYNIAGAIALASDTHSEFGLSMCPTWSGLSREENNLRVRLNAAEPAKVDATMHVLLSLRDLCGQQFLQLSEAAEVVIGEIEKQGGSLEHIPLSGFTPDHSS